MPRCPECEQAGRKVKPATLQSLLRAERRGDIGAEQYYVCTTPGCDTVYFAPEGDAVFRKSDLTVRFGLKETTGPRPLCYCFGHTVEEIEDEIRRTGRSTVVDSIKANLKGAGCRCEHTNPLGGCCLKSVQAVVADARHSIGSAAQAATAGPVGHGDCCAGNGRAAEGADSGRGRTGVLAATGSVVAAVLSSACCWLPLALVAFGASAAGVGGFFESYRPYFIGAAAVLLASGFYMVYFRRHRCEPGSACAVPNRRPAVLNQVMLWTATAMVGAFTLFPDYAGLVFGSPKQASGILEAADLVGAEFHIEGMTCEGCANLLHGVLTRLPGVKAAEVAFDTKTAVVRYAPDEPVPPQQIIKAVKAAGYSARLAENRPR
jgi:copper chaperone CopZ